MVFLRQNVWWEAKTLHQMSCVWKHLVQLWPCAFLVDATLVYTRCTQDFFVKLKLWCAARCWCDTPATSSPWTQTNCNYYSTRAPRLPTWSPTSWFFTAWLFTNSLVEIPCATDVSICLNSIWEPCDHLQNVSCCPFCSNTLHSSLSSWSRPAHSDRVLYIYMAILHLSAGVSSTMNFFDYQPINPTHSLKSTA